MKYLNYIALGIWVIVAGIILGMSVFDIITVNAFVLIDYWLITRIVGIYRKQHPQVVDKDLKTVARSLRNRPASHHIDNTTAQPNNPKGSRVAYRKIK